MLMYFMLFLIQSYKTGTSLSFTVFGLKTNELFKNEHALLQRALKAQQQSGTEQMLCRMEIGFGIC